jgi:hypothetical protein
MLTTHTLLVPRLRKSWAIPPLTLWVLLGLLRVSFYLLCNSLWWCWSGHTSCFENCQNSQLEPFKIFKVNYCSYQHLSALIHHITALEGYRNQDVTDYVRHDVGSSLVSYLRCTVVNATNIMGVAPVEVSLHPNRDNTSGFYPSVKFFPHCCGLKLVIWALIYIIWNTCRYDQPLSRNSINRMHSTVLENK